VRGYNDVITSRDVLFKEELTTSTEDVDHGDEAVVEVEAPTETDCVPSDCCEVENGSRTLCDNPTSCEV